MKYEFLILFLGLFFLVTGYSKQLSRNEKEVEIKYIPRNIYDELVMNSVIS